MDPKPFSRRLLGDNQVVDLYCLQSRDIDREPETAFLKNLHKHAVSVARSNCLSDFFVGNGFGHRKWKHSRGPRVKNVKRHGWTLRLWPRPDITERIQNLIDEAMLP